MFWWRNRRAPSTGSPYRTGASSERSRPVPRLVVLDVLVLSSWSCRPSRWCFCFLAGRYSVPFTPGHSAVSQFQVHIPGFFSGHEVLALVRPVVPYTLVRSRPDQGVGFYTKKYSLSKGYRVHANTPFPSTEFRLGRRPRSFTSSAES